jgi:hypothetical protein
MNAEESGAGRILLDTNVVIFRRDVPPGYLTGEVSISAVPLAELTAGVHMCRFHVRPGASER